MRVIIVYDITEERRRRHLRKELKAIAQRVQYSGFEADLQRDAESAIRARIERIAHPDEDHVRIYRLCRGCAARTWLWGKGGFVDDPEDAVF